MGRRKIEIQPITHERNRSVTFLKRKNGLFKKAYELGVLCSVDVAVIIFEERPGHHAKLYQYCSTDVNSMVQRHLRFDGERDTKGPSDFNNATKADEPADDDDEVDDDDSSQKRRDSTRSVKVKHEGSTNNTIPLRGGLKSPTDPSASPDLGYRSNMRVSPTASTSSPGLPLSVERHTSAITSATRGVPISSTAKRPRLGIDDPSHMVQSPPAGLSANSNHVGAGGSPTFPFRLDVDLPSSYPSSAIPSLSQMHSPHPSLTALYPSSSIPNIMSAASSSFLSQSFDLSRGQQGQPPSLRTMSFPHSASSQSQYSPHGHQQPPSLFGRHNSHTQNSAGNIFAELLGSSGEHGNGAGGHGSSSQFPSFDWPVHSTQASQQSGQGQPDNGAPQGSPPGDSNWFDFLGAGTGQNTNVSAAGLSLPPPVPPLNSARFAMQGPGSSPGLGRKRLRDEGGGGGGGALSDSGESADGGGGSMGMGREREMSVSIGNGSGADRKS